MQLWAQQRELAPQPRAAAPPLMAHATSALAAPRTRLLQSPATLQRAAFFRLAFNSRRAFLCNF